MTGSGLLTLWRASLPGWRPLLLTACPTLCESPLWWGGTSLMETWTLLWHEPISLIHRTWSRQHGGIKQLWCGAVGWFSSVCHPEARKNAKLCSNQSFRQWILLIRSSSLSDYEINCAIWVNQKLTYCSTSRKDRNSKYYTECRIHEMWRVEQIV